MSNFAWWYYGATTCSHHFQWPWPYFKVMGVPNRFYWKRCVLVRVSWNFMELLSTTSRSWTYRRWMHICKGNNLHLSAWGGASFHVGFFSDTIKRRSFKLCIIITLFGDYVVILGLMTLTLVHGHRYVGYINSKLHVWDSCLCKHCMVAAYIKKVMHNMIWMPLMCIQGR